MIERDSQSAQTGQAQFAAGTEAIRRNFLSCNRQRRHLWLETARMLDKLKHLFSKEERQVDVQARLEKLRDHVPAPVFWLIGKTQSGKTSIIKYLTGADAAEIGKGFKPCTRFSRIYQFPTPEAPLVSFLDTRGLDEPGYDSKEDLAQFNTQAHAVIVTVKALDHAQENVRKHLQLIRAAQPKRPIVLTLTCLHEAYPQQQHPEPYPFDQAESIDQVPKSLRRTLEEQGRQFAGLVDTIVPLDLTPAEEGFTDPNYGGPRLKYVLLEALPGAYRQTLASLEQAVQALKDDLVRPVLPHILGYSTLAASAGAISVPWIDLLLLPGIQKRMIHHLAEYFGKPLTAERFEQLAETLGLGNLLRRQAAREVMKFIPVVGPVFCGVQAGASTYALGKAFCYYERAARGGKLPNPEELRKYYREQMALAVKEWRAGTDGKTP
jgi:uncharacterized protein (DUF697 family)